MRNALKTPALIARLRASTGRIYFFDFDGTLSPLAKMPAAAKLPFSLRSPLAKCARRYPTLIVSGRALQDIRKKINVPGLLYAGNHGLQWQIGRRAYQAPVPTGYVQALARIRKQIRNIFPAFPGVILEDKGLCFSVHFRLLPRAREQQFRRALAGVMSASDTKGIIRILRGKKVIELRPDIINDKGYFVRAMVRMFEKKQKRRLLPVYIGDDRTDEDAFRELKQGITIRIGTSRVSQANFYLPRQSDVEDFINRILL